MKVNWSVVMKAARARLGLSQLDFGGRVRMNAAEIGRIERGKAIPSTAELERISREVEAPLSEIIAAGE